MKGCSVVRLVVAAAAASAATTVFAGRYWVCNSDDARFSNTNNWAESTNGVGGKSKPGDGATGTTYFSTYKNGGIVFDEFPALPGNVMVGTQSSDYFTWSAVDSSCGLFATNNYLYVGANISGSRTPTCLQIDSGTYYFKYARIGYESGGPADYAEGTLTVKGGIFTTTSTSSSESMTVGCVTNSTGTVVVDTDDSSVLFAGRTIQTDGKREASADLPKKGNVISADPSGKKTDRAGTDAFKEFWDSMAEVAKRFDKKTVETIWICEPG